VQTETAWGHACCRQPAIIFCQLIPRISLLVFLLVSAAIDDKSCFKYKRLGHWAVVGLCHWFDSRFLGEFSWRVENTRKSSLQPSVLLAFLLVSGSKRSLRISAIPNEGIEQIARKNDGACAKPKQRRRARFRIPEPRYSRSV
jgi:hypothetical protein